MAKRFLFILFIMLLVLTACQQAIPTTPFPTPSNGIGGNATEGPLNQGTYQPTLPIAPSPTPSNGIEGFVTEGPTCPGPVPVGSTECQDQPYQATIEVLSSDNKIITQFQTDANGYFKLILSPGTYILHPISGKPLPHAPDQTVVVTANHFTQVTIQYDTGLR
jgi:hypothetical protein